MKGLYCNRIFMYLLELETGHLAIENARDPIKNENDTIAIKGFKRFVMLCGCFTQKINYLFKCQTLHRC